VRTAKAQPETRERIYDAAERLMLEKGYPATTVDEICVLAGVTKGSFFHYFTSKDHLGRALLERYIGQRVAEMAPLLAEPDPLKRLYGHLDHCIVQASDPEARRGCIMGMFAQELGPTHPEIRALCADAFRRWTEQLEGDLAAALRLRQPRAEVDPRGLAEHFAAIMEGSLILARVNPETDMVGRNLRHFRSYLEMLFGPP
jgi:TetR/AcrR family transcriptional repressor of nem operon